MIRTRLVRVQLWQNGGRASHELSLKDLRLLKTKQIFDNGGGITPQRVICQGCGALLYEGIELIPPDEVIQHFDGKCPRCGKKLSLTPVKVEVEPVATESSS